MNKLIETLQQEKGFLEEQIVKLNKLLADQPEGFVRVSASDKRTQFYYYSGVNDQRNGKYMYGIPYRYEYPIRIKGLGKFYPDFTILDVKNRKEMLLEHLGMMDNEEYASRALSKISTYEKNGIVLGKDIFFTYETSREPFDGRMFDRALINYGLL